MSMDMAFELKASSLLGWYSYHLSHSISPGGNFLMNVYIEGTYTNSNNKIYKLLVFISMKELY
jgi:hypothetical protein